MQPKLIRTQHGNYTPVEWSGENESCIKPFGERVLVLTDPFSPKSTSGKIEFLDDMVDRMSEAAETGTLIAIGSKAWAKSSDEKPEVGQRVIFEKYAGSYQWGADGRRYRLMDDRCIGGLVIEPKPQTLTKVTKPSIIVTRGA